MDLLPDRTPNGYGSAVDIHHFDPVGGLGDNPEVMVGSAFDLGLDAIPEIRNSRKVNGVV